MDLVQIQQGIACDCGRVHRAGIRRCAYEAGVIGRLPGIIELR